MSIEQRDQLVIIDHGEGDEPLSNRQMNRLFSSVLEARLARRQLLKGSAGAAALGFFGLGLAGCKSSSSSDDNGGSPSPAPLLGFSAVAVSSADEIVVPEGYSYQVIIPWGTPILGSFPSFSVNSTGADQAEQVGSHHDGMHFYPIDGSSDDGLLVLNHEYVEPRLMHAAAQGLALTSSALPPLVDGERPADQVRKEANAHGVSVVRIVKAANNEWSVQPDALNRRITALTPMEIHGPVRGSDFVKTLYSPNGTMTRGTLNNCGNGYTPWGTYMAAEENWAGYFTNKGDNPREHSRYGVQTGATSRYAWELADNGADEFVRFDASIKGATAADDYRNEPVCFGWMVEIDPFDPTSNPKKRTAMGRFGHEGVVFAPAEEGKPVVCYSGDDSRFEYIYKFVTAANYNAATANGSLLDEGTLYVARFNDDGTGEWLPLVYGQNGLDEANGFTSQADVLVNTRLAADFMGATPMDRPEWGAVDPANGDVYFTLTNNTSRNAGNVNEANPRVTNRHGHIIRWKEDGGEQAATTFSWDIFLFGGDSGESGVDTNIGYDPNGDVLIADNILSSPDGLWIDPDSRVWIQMDSGYTDPFGNCAMLVADPTTGDLKRFLVGPIDQEITGITMTPDQRTLFINVQHPGEGTSATDFAAGNYTSSWPDFMPATRPPRSATVVVWKNDGGIVGS
ncbi:PhoX family phosphatase [Halopseudomonas aestusnigri]|jgi:secreted PhoX family phosphatase|uniref:PhoX family protein n=1 Tax=Halopseudomonas aestusnigri TaxID=857252 RepID=UPI001E30F115|nr:PhoX family phosphatase [Halopseudomonas aestusnigri]UGV31716.1 PhoX family phosphatase [Halopseudomonas aestusnigri]